MTACFADAFFFIALPPQQEMPPAAAYHPLNRQVEAWLTTHP